MSTDAGSAIKIGRGGSPPQLNTGRLCPLTERILVRVPGPRVQWIVTWALLPWLNAGANLLLETGERSAIWEQSLVLIILNYAALSLAIVVTFWGSEHLAQRMETLQTTTLEGDASHAFRETNSVIGPLLTAAATAIAFALSALVADGWQPAMLRGTTWLLLGIPICGFLWTYAALQLGLDRLGRERFRPEVSSADPTLGLEPLGSLAFLGLWLLLAALVPVLLTGLPDVVGVVLGALVLGIALAAFFFSLLRLHHQMVRVKASELAIARELYTQAYEPVRTERTLEALERQHALLGAADALEKRAHGIRDWPVDEGTIARVATITTSVIAITIGRLIAEPLGL